MNCQLCQRELDAYHEGQLPDGIRIQVESHLASCLDCSKSYQLFTLANKVMDTEKRVISNPFLVTRIMAGIEETDSKSERFKRIPAYYKVLRPVFISVSLAVAVFIGVLVGSTYLPTESAHRLPVELSYMNDAALESVDLYSQL